MPLKSFLSKPVLFIACLVLSFLIYYSNSTVQTVGPMGVGSDLYFAQAVAKGHVPYHDFNDVYGPLMHYVNALVLTLFGSDVHSLIWSKVIFKTLSSGVFFLAATRIMPPLFALLASLAFGVFTPDFTHNVKSYAIICIETGSLWAILSYYFFPNKKYILWGILSIVSLGLIKIDFGIVSLASTFLTFFLFDLFKHRRPILESMINYCLYSIAIMAVWFVIYFVHLWGLTSDEIQQCLPFVGKYAYHDGSFYNSLINSIKASILGTPPDLYQTAIKYILYAAILRLIVRLVSRYSCATRFTSLHRDYTLIIVSLLICIVASNSEYYIGGAEYESFYSRPFAVMVIAYFISEASLISGVLVRSALLLFFSVTIITTAYTGWKGLDVYKNPKYLFKYPGINVYVTNDPRDMNTMIQTADYVKDNIKANESVFIFPCDGIYYFLIGKLSPSRLIFLLHKEQISTEQQIALINNLEKKNTTYIVLDNICYYGAGGYDDYGNFGRDNCLLFYRYFTKYFEEVANFGNVPGAPVGTKVFKRKPLAPIYLKTPRDLN